MTLHGPSKTIIVEPLKVPAKTDEPAKTPAPPAPKVPASK